MGEQVWAYNPSTKKMELQPILHVWINHDNDLVDLTITKAPPGKGTQPSSEVLHTNKKHPFLTLEKGFLSVGQIKLGMHVVEANGQVGVVSGWKVVPGIKVMYNLEVARDHTYTVGAGRWVVHNSNCIDPLGQSLAAGRQAFGIPPRSLNPDDGQTFAKLYADGKEYWGVNGSKYIPFAVNSISKTHAEIDVLAQLYRDREIMGDSGGAAVMLVDRVACRACFLNGIRSGVRAARLDSLIVYAEGRIFEVLP